MDAFYRNDRRFLAVETVDHRSGPFCLDSDQLRLSIDKSERLVFFEPFRVSGDIRSASNRDDDYVGNIE